MGYARVCVTADFLSDIFHFPPGTRVLYVSWDDFERQLVLTVAHDNLKDYNPLDGDGEPPVTAPSFRKNQPVDFVSWGAQEKE